LKHGGNYVLPLSRAPARVREGGFSLGDLEPSPFHEGFPCGSSELFFGRHLLSFLLSRLTRSCATSLRHRGILFFEVVVLNKRTSLFMNTSARFADVRNRPRVSAPVSLGYFFVFAFSVALRSSVLSALEVSFFLSTRSLVGP